MIRTCEGEVHRDHHTTIILSQSSTVSCPGRPRIAIGSSTPLGPAVGDLITYRLTRPAEGKGQASARELAEMFVFHNLAQYWCTRSPQSPHIQRRCVKGYRMSHGERSFAPCRHQEIRPCEVYCTLDELWCRYAGAPRAVIHSAASRSPMPCGCPLRRARSEERIRQYDHVFKLTRS